VAVLFVGGLTPKHKESDEAVHRGAITKQGSGLVRWAAIEAVGNYRQRGNEKLRADYLRIAERRDKYRARVAVVRKLLTLVFYGLRDGEVPCLRPMATWAVDTEPTRARLSAWSATRGATGLPVLSPSEP
jgi:hypothetical protein